MVIAMSRPIARTGSRHLSVRQRIPADVRRILATIPDWPRPKGWGKEEIVISTGPYRLTGETEKDTAARLYADIAATFARLRNGPQSLTDAQLAALAGEAFTAATSPPDPAAPRSTAFTLTAFSDRLLASKGLWLTAQSRADLMTALMGKQGSVIKATSHNAARASGDYTTPPPAFPVWEDTAPAPASPAPGKAIKLSALVQDFLTQPRLQSKQLSRHTKTKYGHILTAFHGFLKDPDARTITEDDIRRFNHDRLTVPSKRTGKVITARTLHKGDLPAIKSLFAWATNKDEHSPRTPLTDNPSTGITIKTDSALGHQQSEEGTFTDDEIRMILTAALAVTISDENPTLDRANRWAPWIAAYTGARITSICSLTGSDFQTREGVYCMRFPPEKDVPVRFVPVHAHLLKLGLKQLATRARNGPLFYDPDRARVADGPDKESTQGENRAKDVAEWIRDIGLSRTTVKPNHGWRNTFITRASGRMPEVHARYIAGHSKRSMGVHASVYTNPNIAAYAASLAKFPRYDITPPTEALESPQTAKDGNQLCLAPVLMPPQSLP